MCDFNRVRLFKALILSIPPAAPGVFALAERSFFKSKAHTGALAERIESSGEQGMFSDSFNYVCTALVGAAEILSLFAHCHLQWIFCSLVLLSFCFMWKVIKAKPVV